VHTSPVNPNPTPHQQNLIEQAKALMSSIQTEIDAYDSLPHQQRRPRHAQFRAFRKSLQEAGIFSTWPLPSGPCVLPDPTDSAFIVPARSDEHEGWIFKREVNLIAGASGTGKTTIALDLLEQARRGESVLGHPALPREYRILMFDRSEEAFERTAKRMGLSSEARQRVYRPDQRQSFKLAEVLNSYMGRLDDDELFGDGDSPGYPDVVFIEGLDMLVPGGEVLDFDTVSRFLEELAEIARFWNIAILGSVGSPKQKSDSRYLLARDNIFGSVAWGRKSETILHVQLREPENPNSARQLVVLPRNGQAETFRLRFRYGRLEEAPELDGVAETREALKVSDFDRFASAVRGLAPGTPVNTRFVPGLSRQTVSRYLCRLQQQDSALVGKPGGVWTRL
jgi:hypothetical protein